MFRIRMISPILKATGLVHATVVFIITFLVCAAMIVIADPYVARYGDVLWFCFQAVTTIGFGDVVITSPVARIVTVVLSLYSFFYVAVITGAVVGVCQEMLKVRFGLSVAALIDKIEHLHELSPAELEELSKQVKKVHR